MLSCPGAAISMMEDGGKVFENNTGEFVELDDVRLDWARAQIDVTHGSTHGLLGGFNPHDHDEDAQRDANLDAMFGKEGEDDGDEDGDAQDERNVLGLEGVDYAPYGYDWMYGNYHYPSRNISADDLYGRPEFDEEPTRLPNTPRIIWDELRRNSRWSDAKNSKPPGRKVLHLSPIRPRASIN
jgi:hypothetical protein